ncbi:hypothetical protein Lal_00034965 [Lupinus albus]|nr:hypothetical protein Lal_00034965 [Lupinus albus]
MVSLGWACVGFTWPAYSKFRVELWVLGLSSDWRAMREAGFTEQRIPPALNSGGITGHCFSSPQWAW